MGEIPGDREGADFTFKKGSNLGEPPVLEATEEGVIEKFPEKVEDPKDKYGDMDGLLTVELLASCYDDIKAELDHIYELSEDLKAEFTRQREHSKKFNEDPWDDSTRYMFAFREALKNFTINNKVIDLTKLSDKPYSEELVYNKMCDAVWRYAHDFLPSLSADVEFPKRIKEGRLFDGQ